MIRINVDSVCEYMDHVLNPTVHSTSGFKVSHAFNQFHKPRLFCTVSSARFLPRRRDLVPAVVIVTDDPNLQMTGFPCDNFLKSMFQKVFFKSVLRFIAPCILSLWSKVSFTYLLFSVTYMSCVNIPTAWVYPTPVRL